MEIKDILSKLGIDFSNPDAKRGALEAIDAILSSRVDLGSGGAGGGPDLNGNGGEIEVEIDPDLLQPSVKHHPKGGGDDLEVEDEEKLLDKIKHNKAEDEEEPETRGQDNQSNSEDSSESGESSDFDGSDESSEQDDTDDSESADTGDTKETSETENSEEVEEEEAEDSSEEDSEEDSEEGENSEDTNTELDGESEIADETEDSDEEAEFSDEEEFPDEHDWLDDDTRDAMTDNGISSKAEARKVKRERTLLAAKEALRKANERGASKALISELESAIEALEALTEAVAKNIADVSDEEFNQLVNRVFDAIDALGTGDLTYSSEEDRQARAQEIKTDLASSKTQAELSAEDAAQIRAETQAIKAREKEADKYKTKSRSSFQGFQAFMDSLQRGIALQVSYEEERDDTWSAISRRNSGAGVLRQGQKINELPNKKIPIIDFYFDQSGSWDESDVEVGNQAVEALAKMQEDGKIKINIYYFSNHVHTDAASARAEGGTRAWNDIIKNIITTEATNVVIMTDSDMEDWWDGPKALSYTVPGFVWYLWRNGVNAPRLPRDLKGRGGTMQYSF